MLTALTVIILFSKTTNYWQHLTTPTRRNIMSKDRCCVQSCLRQQGKNTYLFPFPVDPIRKEVWRDKLKVKRSDVSQLVVCGTHFRRPDFRDYHSTKTLSFTRLNANAIPSRNLPFDKDNPSSQSTVVGIEIDANDGTSSAGSTKDSLAMEDCKRYHRRNCAVPACCNGKGATNVSVTLFRVPKNEPRLNLWKKILKTDLKSSSFVCPNHFNYTDIFPPPNAESSRLRLKKNARPTLNPVKKPDRNIVSLDDSTDNDERMPFAAECKSGDVVECNGERYVISFLN